MEEIYSGKQRKILQNTQGFQPSAARITYLFLTFLTLVLSLSLMFERVSDSKHLFVIFYMYFCIVIIEESFNLSKS